MKSAFVLTGIFISVSLSAQNVGIGTNSPTTTLDVRGNHRVGGLSSYLLFDSSSGRFEWRNANLYVPVTQALMKHSAAADGLFYNNTAPTTGQLEYRNAAGEPVFYTNFMNGNGYFKSNLGIGITPTSKLHVNSGTVRFEGTAGVGGPALSIGGVGNISVDAPGFTGGRFTINDDGQVGIGTASPMAKLHVIRGSSTATAMLNGSIYGTFFNYGSLEDTYINGGKDGSYVLIGTNANARVGVGISLPGAMLHVKRGTGDATANFDGTNWTTHINYGINEDTYIRPGKNNGKVIINDIAGGMVGIGTSSPLARLHVSEYDVLFSSSGDIPASPDPVPIQGLGRRLMWYADKAAFRVGYDPNFQWDEEFIGNYSFGSGTGSRASGVVSTALGASWAAGDYSTSIGMFSHAFGYNSFAACHGEAFGGTSTAVGYGSRAYASASIALGYFVYAKSYSGVAVGMNNDTSYTPDPFNPGATDRIFEIGNGNSTFSKSNALTVLRNGNVGIGTTTPGFPLNFSNTLGDKISLFGSAGAHYGFGIQGSLLQIHSGTSIDDIAFGYGSSTGFTERMRIKGTGFVGIGTAAPFTQLCVNGNIAYAGYLGACSDIRYKKDFSSFANPLKDILSINGFYYHWKQDEFSQMKFTDGRQIGFSAQEIEKLFPELVMVDDNGYKSVDYGRLTPVLVEGIKEQQKQIDSLQVQIQKQQKQIDELKLMVEKSLQK